MLRVGLIGSGYWARQIHGLSASRHPEVQLVGVWGRDQMRTADAAAELGCRTFDNLDQLIDEVDALTFAVPPDVQAEIAIRAARAGRHLLLEKPLATSVAAALQLEAAVAQAKVGSIVFFTRRFIPELESWLCRLQEVGGWECGRAEFAASIFVEGNPFGASPWRHEKGALWDIGPHALSQLWPVLGEVRAVLAGAGVRDQVHLVLQHGDRRSSTASLSLTVPPAATATTVYVYGPQGREVAPSGPFDSVAAHGRALDALLQQVAHPGSGHPCDVHFGARVVEVLAAAEQSLNSGRVVHLEPH
jgi:predicted dehydrogenase